MKKIQLAVAIIILVIITAGYYIHEEKEERGVQPESAVVATTTLDIQSVQSAPATTTVKEKFSTTIKGNTFTVVQNGKVAQTLIANADVPEIIPPAPVSSFITDKDINFDGHNDLAVMSGMGYGGVNYFYDFYLYNPKTSMFERTSILPQLSNPAFDLLHNKITWSIRSGPSWNSGALLWNGTRYADPEPVINFVSPKRRQVLKLAQNVHISWSRHPLYTNVHNVIIDLVTNTAPGCQAAVCNSIAVYSGPDTGSFDWTAPEFHPFDGDYYFRIRPDVNDAEAMEAESKGLSVEDHVQVFFVK